MMKKIFYISILIVMSAVKPALAGDPVFGLWLTENERSVIDVRPCGEKLCGYVHWIIGGGMQTDANNPDEALRGRSMCGLEIMSGLDRAEEGEWEDGKIYKADDGDIYDADIEIEDDGRLNVRGYMGLSLFGKSQDWTKVTAHDYPNCKN